MSERALILYGSAAKATHDHGIFEDRAGMAGQFRQHGIELHIGYTNDPPQAADVQPTIVVSERLVFDGNGDLSSDTTFRQGSIEEMSLVYDRWSENYNQTAPLNRAPGIGIRDGRVINHFSVQNLGRSKVEMGRLVLNPLKIGIPQYTTSEALDFLEQNPGKKIFAKPDEGSRGKDARAITKATDLDGLDAGTVLQEFCDTTRRLSFLRPYTDADKESFRDVNQEGHEKEIRMYTIYSTHPDGKVQKDFWPILRTRAPHSGVIKYDSINRTRIDPESVPTDFYQLAEACGDRIMTLTGVKHLYIAVDLSQVTTQLGEERTVAIEINSRFPGLWERADGARKMIADQAAIIASY